MRTTRRAALIILAGALACSAAGVGGPAATPLARSADGAYSLALDAREPVLLVLDARGGEVLKRIALESRDGKRTTRVASAITAPPRGSFVIALRDIPELWEISYDPRAEDFYEGLVHDFRMGEGVPTKGFLGVRRISIGQPMAELTLEGHGAEVSGPTWPREDGTLERFIVNLDVRRVIRREPLRRR